MINPTSSAAQPAVNRTSQSLSVTAKQAGDAAASGAKAQDSTVIISEQGKAASRIEVGSLESHRLPNWMVDLMPAQNLSNAPEAIKETRAHIAMLEQRRAEGKLSPSEKAAVQEYWANNSPATEQMRDTWAFRKEFEDELAEYSQLRDDAYRQARMEHGIHTLEDYVAKVLNAPDDNLALRNTVVEKLLDNPRALELMDTLGIARPSLA